MPLKEYRCKAHGEFESYDAVCPHGCSKRFVVQEFRTAFKIGTRGAKVMDQTTKDLAGDFGLSDVRVDKDGGSVMDALRKADNADFRPRWGAPAKEVSSLMGSAGVQGQQMNIPKLPKLTPQIVGRHTE